MINGKRILAVLPARGGSKGIPRKNIRAVGGKPLLAWTIEEARRSRFVDRLVLSSDDPEIMAVAASLGCEVPFRRPSELAEDDTPGIAPVLHAIEHLPGYDYVVLLQATSPLRLAEDIDACISLCHEQAAPACVSVTRCGHNPHLMFWRGEDRRLKKVIEGVVFPCRQQMPTAFFLNGAVYVADCAWLQNSKTFLSADTHGYEMPASRSLDIDSEEELKYLEGYFAEKATLDSKGGHLRWNDKGTAFPASESPLEPSQGSGSRQTSQPQRS